MWGGDDAAANLLLFKTQALASCHGEAQAVTPAAPAVPAAGPAAKGKRQLCPLTEPSTGSNQAESAQQEQNCIGILYDYR